MATGHLTDSPERAVPRFPERAVDAVAATCERVLRGWGLGTDDLLICGGARGGDLLAAGTARSLGATVWLLLAQPPDEFEAASVAGADIDWVSEFRGLLHRVPSWVLDAAHPSDPGPGIYAETNRWILEVAEVQAEAGHLRLLAVWDGRPGDGPGGTGDMVETARALGAEVVRVDPSSGSSTDLGKNRL